MDKCFKVEFPIVGKFVGVENVDIKVPRMVMKVPFYVPQGFILYS